MNSDIKAAQFSCDMIVQDILLKVAGGKYKKGQKLPPVREMAVLWSVNANTAQRAYTRLTQASVLTTRRGVGTYVVDDEEWLQQFRVNLISQKADAFMKEMKEMGVSPEEIIAHLRHKHPRRKAAAKKR